MMQGDSYYLGIDVLNNADQPVTPDDVMDVEITIGNLTKTYMNAQVIFCDGKWMFPLSQKETFKYWPGNQESEVRVVWADGVIENMPLYGVHIFESRNKGVR